MRAEKVLISIAFIGSAALALGMFIAFVAFHSQLALAQAADSLQDVFTSLVLGWTVAIASKPADSDHPFGHHRAEPIGALFVALVAGVLAIEVGRSAIASLFTDAAIRTDWLLLGVFAGKLVFKSILWVGARSVRIEEPRPAIRALIIDAQNDILVSLVAIAGFFAARSGWPGLDAWLALPVAMWIGWSGIDLARENIRLLMGESPDAERCEQLLQAARAIDGVRDAHDLRAHYLGTRLQVYLHIIVDETLSVAHAHDIGELVRERIQRDPDVGTCLVHIDIE